MKPQIDAPGSLQEPKRGDRRSALGGGCASAQSWITAPIRQLPLLVVSLHTIAAQSEPIVYERDIAPIFRTYCAGCHNNEQLEGELSIETYSSLRKGGADEGDPIKPGNPDESFLIRSLERRSTPRMPPRDEPRVPEPELARLRQWIAEGARGPKHDVSILASLVVPSIQPEADLEAPITSATLSPDGRLLAIGKFQKIELRNFDEDRTIRTIPDLPGKVTALRFSPEGRRLVAATGITGLRGVAILFDVERGEVKHEFAGHRDMLYDAEFSPDGKLLATAGYDRAIRLWRTADGALLHSIDVHKSAVFDLAFHPHGAVLASASADETVKLWRVSDGARLDTLNQPQGEQYAVRFTPDGEYILSAGADRRIHMWRFVSRNEPALNPVVHSRFAHESSVIALSISGGGEAVVSAADDRTLKVWSLPDLTEQHAYEPQPDTAAVLASIPNSGQFLSLRMDGSVGRYTIRTDAARATAETSPPALHFPEPSAEPSKIAEMEPNNLPEESTPISPPAEITGSISSGHDSDLFRFHARAGAELALEVNAARSGSSLDSRVQVLHSDGRAVEQVVLRAVRDSWFTFRGKDSSTSDDFRLHNWREMELDEYLYANGEVARLWLYPRGPDSGFKVYPGFGARQTVFFTTALSHPLGEPCFIVSPLPPGSQPPPNGLPIFRLNYENDDDPARRLGTDSLLLFIAPADGEYLARVTDVRGFGGATDFHYTLAIRGPRPGFKVSVGGKDPKVSPGSGRELTFNAERYEGFDGPIQIELENLPPGFSAISPVVIEAGQSSAVGALYAAPDAADPDERGDKAVRIIAHASVRGREISHELGTLGDLGIGDPAKVTVEILPSADRSSVKDPSEGEVEFTIRPGETITALVRAERHDFEGRIELGKEDSGRNLPHGVYVDNIGLNGLLIVEGQTQREFFITASAIAQPGARLFHLRATADGGQVSRPARLRVLPPAGIVGAREADRGD